ncbi:MAG: hypothetical protein A3F83_12525 [Candidatus Glassbacteria bacterium RIFCSPLOWO2_12_FULL_58_11]|uniref:Uncharacterized protein n=1 Tax=Candidatus Glassbacteria bacterium RIFCSPLOWO2_12_FULL_58_11 TaxID=1817867 RepID=A0A1F5YM25_9BACT|nr:MAG: hypothetical protein A3F83_12525 [Candidatus Glassbacteria bacterium RIFCSPLOWO2_12_FULL_58_11]
MNRILPKIWIAYLVLLPLNLTYFLGAGPALPADLVLILLLAAGLTALVLIFGRLSGMTIPLPSICSCSRSAGRWRPQPTV